MSAESSTPYFRCALAAAERQITAATDRVPAEVVLGFDQEHVGARLSRDDRRRKSRCTGADHDDAGLTIPAPRGPRSLRGRARRAENGCHAGGAGRFDPFPPRNLVSRHRL